MNSLKNYFDWRYQLHLEELTLQSVLNNPSNTQFIRGNDSLSGKRRWAKFYPEDFIQSLYTELKPKYHMIIIWRNNNGA